VRYFFLHHFGDNLTVNQRTAIIIFYLQQDGSVSKRLWARWPHQKYAAVLKLFNTQQLFTLTEHASQIPKYTMNALLIINLETEHGGVLKLLSHILNQIWSGSHLFLSYLIVHRVR
jgi:hypothetical protein